MDELEKGRAYDLLKRIYENDCIITDSLKREMDELFEPEWMKHLED